MKTCRRWKDFPVYAWKKSNNGFADRSLKSCFKFAPIVCCVRMSVVVALNVREWNENSVMCTSSNVPIDIEERVLPACRVRVELLSST